MLNVLVRTLIIYVLVVFVMRIMGKEEVGQLQPFEFVIALLIADLAAVPMQNPQIPLLYGIIPIFLLLIFQYTLSYLGLKSLFIRKLLCGKPTILIYKGEIQTEEMAKIRYNMNDLLEQLRIKGYLDFTEVEYAILETKGELSVFPKQELKPVTRKDMNLPNHFMRFPISLVIDGKILKENLKIISQNEDWLYQKMKDKSVLSLRRVLYAGIDSKGEFILHKKEPKVMSS